MSTVTVLFSENVDGLTIRLVSRLPIGARRLHQNLAIAKNEIMGESFHGWRRKSGILILAIACVFMAGWMRGIMQLTDRVIIPWKTSYSVLFLNNCRIASASGITLCHYPKHERNPGPLPRLVEWETYPATTPENVKISKARLRASPEWVADGNWDCDWFGFVAGGAVYYSMIAIPYWSIVIPLTLLSAFLLLGGRATAPGEKA